MSSTLLIPFKNESRDYMLGFECGILWQQIASGNVPKYFLFHVENSRQAALILKHFNLKFQIKNIDEAWNEITITV